MLPEAPPVPAEPVPDELLPYEPELPVPFCVDEPDPLPVCREPDDMPLPLLPEPMEFSDEPDEPDEPDPVEPLDPLDDCAKAGAAANARMVAIAPRDVRIGMTPQWWIYNFTVLVMSTKPPMRGRRSEAIFIQAIEQYLCQPLVGSPGRR